jgi:hypothetical protein
MNETVNEMATNPQAVTAASTSNTDQIDSACDRFFSIHELVSAFLHEADTLVLVNCQGVCQLWKGIIDRSKTLQENLFLTPVLLKEGEEEALEARLNPILSTHFQSLLGTHERIRLSRNQYALRTGKCSYNDLQKLPLARNSIHTRADAPSAFARREASWRKMLISQPPLKHLYWWHEWESSDRHRTERYSQYPILSGEGRQQVTSDTTTIGTLWDMLEARLLRGCISQVTFFVAGGSAEDDPTASEAEKEWGRETRSRKSEFSLDLPRVRVCSNQVWPGEGPAMYARFNVQVGAWEIHDELPFTPHTDRERQKYERKDGDGLFWLITDCMHDNEDVNWRWSRSDGFENATIRRVSSSVSGSDSRRSRRLRERHANLREANSA